MSQVDLTSEQSQAKKFLGHKTHNGTIFFDWITQNFAQGIDQLITRTDYEIETRVDEMARQHHKFGKDYEPQMLEDPERLLQCLWDKLPSQAAPVDIEALIDFRQDCKKFRRLMVDAFLPLVVQISSGKPMEAGQRAIAASFPNHLGIHDIVDRYFNSDYEDAGKSAESVMDMINNDVVNDENRLNGDDMKALHAMIDALKTAAATPAIPGVSRPVAGGRGRYED